MYFIRHIVSADVLCHSSLICQLYFILKRKHLPLEPNFSQKQLQNCVSVVTWVKADFEIRIFVCKKGIIEIVCLVAELEISTGQMLVTYGSAFKGAPCSYGEEIQY